MRHRRGEPHSGEVLPLLPAEAVGEEGGLKHRRGPGPLGLVRASWRIVAFAGLSLALLPPGVVVQSVRGRVFPFMKRWYYRGACRIIGVKVQVVGEPIRGGAVLFVSNHVSYIDVPVIGSQVETRFIAKAEVANWPFFGLCAKLAGTVFIRRDRRREVAAQRDHLVGLLDQGQSLFLFPEGTSSDGSGVLPFKSALLEVAGAGETTVQAVTVAYRDPDRAYAWHGDMTLIPHLGRLFTLKGTTAELTFHPPVSGREAGSRKELARRLQAQVASALPAAREAVQAQQEAAPAAATEAS